MGDPRWHNRKPKSPAPRYHLSCHSVVTIAGRDFYLGPYDSPESIARYAALIAVYQNNGLKLPDGFEFATVDPQVAAMIGLFPMMVTQQSGQPIRVRHVTAASRELGNLRYTDSHAGLAPPCFNRLTNLSA